MLAHQHQRVGEHIERHRQPPARHTHHELMLFEFVAPVFVYAHVLYSIGMGIPNWPVSGARERELLDEVLASDRWGGYHPIVARFEKEFAAFQQCRFGLGAMNGTVTLEMALEALGIGEGDEVIVPAISFISTATAVSRVRATPVFVDIETRHLQHRPASRARSHRPEDARHHSGSLRRPHGRYGFASCRSPREHGIPLVEDAAHAHGSEWNGRRAGSFGVFSSFSFQNGKVMTAGEGGILLSNDEALIDRAREILDIGRRKGEGWFFHYTLGTNYRITALQCAVLIAQLERLPEQNCRRMRNVNGDPRRTCGCAGPPFPARAGGGAGAYELSSARLGGWRSRRVPSQSHSRGISLHAVLSAHAL